ncbi:MULTISPECIES: FAD-dependent monooxygenase [Gordonia]|uniref:Pentachlorophenol monooxygenase n=2 Tax=Gordonia alkanivorans TaxID=84096 RepID=W9D7X9_9ACTN|nr:MULTISPECIES: FAD-dependent monooxygenase [Gordonia]ETA05373.1 pentachlorophenol monooxygenase [Gordonia alkanivorans CGMCC 6845]MDH3006957.1 FAD-dependent monooxygenase [Gordonia alkanivorans]MDH3011871.1 FAD-dependent monooxygenase [Gordonia alkanivorans]MDH3016421.1 FAD-dependent monooxygenase [Gordonia alkanivorans]MDH3020450.1 FAD-dependent monooxygenase [Gordonia alkanivorans]
MNDVDVLIAGAGPIGLTAAIELRRRGVRVRIVDPLLEPPQYAKAVGIQPRTLEVFEGMGVLEHILDAGMEMRGQFVFVNGSQVSRIDLVTPADVPFRFHLLPQYSTERVLRDRLTDLDAEIERGVRVSAFTPDDDGVTVTLTDAAGAETSVRAGYLIGADGAHSTVRKGLGLGFEGGAFTEQYMLGDVAVDWSMPRGYAIRAMHQADDGTTDDLLVCIPLPGRGRYRMSMLVPDELAIGPTSGGDGVAHGFEGTRTPELSHIQAVVDRLSPEPATVSDLRWSSVFRISHRIVDSYGRGRVFVAGDAAHIHPPTGAQGMNTGVQDAHNLAWKLALAVAGDAAPGLLESYDLERRPVGEEVVGRTVRDAREGIGSDSTDVEFVTRREAQLLISYADSPITAGSTIPSAPAAPRAGERAPDAAGLGRDSVNHPLRLYSLLSGVDHALVLYADAAAGAEDVAVLENLAAEVTKAARGHMTAHVVAAPTAQVGSTDLPLLRDTENRFAAGYLPDGSTAFVIRPDGYLGYRGPLDDTATVLAYLRATFA